MVEQPSSISCEGLAVGSVEQVLAAALEAYVCCDESRVVVAWNPAARQIFGHRREQACGNDMLELVVAQGSRGQFRGCFDRVAAGGPGPDAGQRLQLSARHAQGRQFPIEMTLSKTDTDDGPRFHLFAQDVTTAQRAQRFAAVESAVSRGLADAVSSAQAADRVVQAVGVQMSWPVVEMWLADEAQQMLVCAARFTGRDVAQFCLPQLEYEVGLPGAVHDAGEARWIADLGADTGSARSRVAARHGLRVAVGVPIRCGSTVLGALCMYGDHVEDPEDVLTALLAGVAAHTGQYLERRRAEEMAVELARTKDEFLALVTHELRNPLAVITSTAAVFDEELDGADLMSCAQQRKYLRTISRSAQRLAVMAGDLLDLARLESGDMAIDPTATDLAEVIDQAARAVGPAAEAKHIRMQVQVDAPLFLYADADRLRQVADNLLGNAVKYTPGGGTITVTAHSEPATEVDGGDDRLFWTVEDTGIGIPVEEQPRLFRRFYRASTAIEQRIPGTGLGLVVSRTIIERHHGSISLAENDGPGTTFAITLPVKQPG